MRCSMLILVTGGCFIGPRTVQRDRMDFTVRLLNNLCLNIVSVEKINGLNFMNNEEHNNSFMNASDRQKPRSRRLKPLAVLIGLIVVIAVAAGVLYQRWDRQTQTDYKKLVGNWIRPDGGYIISIRDINSDGRVQAAYFNPNSIKVSHAKAAFKGNQVKLFLELRDAGYPGCTYDLSYDKQDDRLRGIYYQAEIQEIFDVVFFRR